MFVVSRRSIILPGPDGEKFRMPRDYMGPVPDWAESSPYLRALVKDGKVVLSDSSCDTDIDAALKRKKGKRTVVSPEQLEGPGGQIEESAGETGEETAEGC